MMKIIKSAIILLVGLLVLAACNNDTSKKKAGNTDNEAESISSDEAEDINDSKGEGGRINLIC